MAYCASRLPHSLLLLYPRRYSLISGIKYDVTLD